MTKIKFSINFFVTKICVHLEHVHDALLVDGNTTTKKENIGKILFVADHALQSWQSYRYQNNLCRSVSVRDGSNHSSSHSHRVTVLNISRLLTAGKCFSNYDSLLRN